jgi:hypothetical protein
MTMIYIATDILGSGVKHIEAFDNRMSFLKYAAEVTAMQEAVVLSRDTISDLCDKLHDSGTGFGARYHFRVSRKDAKEFIRNGAEDIGCWKL